MYRYYIYATYNIICINIIQVLYYYHIYALTARCSVFIKALVFSLMYKNLRREFNCVQDRGQIVLCHTGKEHNIIIMVDLHLVSKKNIQKRKLKDNC